MGIIGLGTKAAKAARAAKKIAKDKVKRKDTVEKIKEAAKEAADKSKKKVYDGDKKATPSSTARAVKAERSKAASEKASETSKKGTQGTGFRFASKKTTSEPAAGRVNARTMGDDKIAYEQEYGRGGKENITSGKKSYARMDEAASKGSRDRAKAKVKAEIAAREGDKKAAAKVKRMDKASAEADKARTRKAAATSSAAARKDRGVSLAGMEGIERFGAKQKFTSKDMMVGNTSNGVTKDGEIVGNPTDNQIQTAVRNMDARSNIAAQAKRNLERLKRMSQKDKQDSALRTMERRMSNTGPDKSGRKFNQGGMPTGKPRNGHTDMRKGGLFK